MAIQKLCFIPDCGKPVYGHGWCRNHWWRWRKHGDPLGGNTVRGEPMRYYHEVVLNYDGKDCLLWPFSRDGNGYGKLYFDGRMQPVSRLVCEEVNGPPLMPSHEAAHSCGNGHLGCVTKGHLTWKTRIENHADQLAHGTRLRGEKLLTAKLTEKAVREIRASNEPLLVLAARYGVSESNVSMVRRGKKWAWLD